jgi:hypothetical protein
MAGIAATLRADQSTLGALSTGLAVRGADVAARHLGPISVLIRAAIPVVHGDDGLALAVDGIAEASTLASRYAEHGPAGLIGGTDPYALVLADAASGTLLAARSGDGPPLYWAQLDGPRHGPHVLVASEPGALLAAGVPAEPDREVVERFIATGACDDTDRTFFAAIRRILPGQVVEARPAGPASLAVRTHQIRAVPGGVAPAAIALPTAAASGRIGVRLGHGLAGAAVLGTALTRPDRPRPLPVYSTSFPGLASATAEYAAAVLGPLPLGAVRHRARPFFADELDLDGFLRDVGEPVPDLAGYLLWATAKAVAGEVDALLDTAGAEVLLPAAGTPSLAQRLAATGYLSRLADRVATRFGVTLRFPFREMINTGEALRTELADLIDRALPSAAARYAAAQPVGLVTGEPPLREVLARMPERLAGTFLSAEYASRPWAAPRATLAAFQALVAGRPARPFDFGRPDAGQLFRRYLVERWLRLLAPPVPADPVVPTVPPVPVDSVTWARFPIRTDALVPGDRAAEKLGFYVAEFAPVLGADKAYRDALHRPWYLLVAAKPVAVSQGRAKPLWEIRPGPAARVGARLFGRGAGLSTPWAFQLAIAESGTWRTLLGTACAVLGQRGWYQRLAPAATVVRGPREDALPPARVGVVAGPVEPSRVAAELLGVLRTGLPAAAYQSLAGVAVVAVDESGCQVLGWAPGKAAGEPTGPTTEMLPGAPVELIVRLAAGNPLGQGEECTPLLVAVHEPARPERPNAGKRAKQRAAAKRAHPPGGVAPSRRG